MTELINLNKSQSNLFVLNFPQIPVSDGSVKELMLNINNTIIPGVSIGSENMSYMGAVIKRPAAKVDFGMWTTGFIVDERLNNWKMLFKWMMFINNNKDKFVGKNFQVDASLQIFDNFKTQTMTIKIYNIWPTALGSVNLSYTEGVQISCNVDFSYDRYEIQD